MKTSLDHLPAGKRKELDLVVSVLREGFASALGRRTMPRFRNGKLLKIILFGSFARGDWVEDPKGRYFSDFDILVVVNHEDLTWISFTGATRPGLARCCAGVLVARSTLRPKTWCKRPTPG